ncbi:MAG: hypothetical protein NZL95_00270 [Chitinophagales bacterium]|nr:hypothetical protein [Chitinophagales bacterium]MDW8426975.1 FlgD immunoglobulin-like domain containing protein [Chitinophagales bacterium]
MTELTGFYRSGQVFLTWKNPGALNLQYNLYRSTEPIVDPAHLNSSTYRGFVRDYSGKNVRKSTLKNKDFYYVITEGQSALASDRGLYVATSTHNGTFYYAVTVTDLTTGIEDKTLILGGNSLLYGIQEQVAKPQPVLQTITNQSNGDISYEYVIWGDNHSSPLWPAFNNVGSFGYLFTLQKRGNAEGQPLFVQFADQSPLKKISSDLCSNCNMLQPDDWLPNGSNTYWIGYNNSYNMYVPNYLNPIVTSGVVHTFTQKRLREILLWARRQPGVDSNRVYFRGKSHNGFGALITALNNPDIVSAFYVIVAPVFYKTVNGDRREHTFCKASSNLPTDVTYPGTNDSILIWDFTDARTYYNMHKNAHIPFGQGIHGRNDTKIGWVGSIFWYDTLNRYPHGGLWYWDRRKHNGNQADFTDAETFPDFLRFANNKSYPAFCFSTSNHNPGNGSASNGDPYGAYNAYMDWDHTSIVDNPCSYSIYCFLRTFYKGGVADSRQFDTCRADLILRRTQQFKPLSGQTLNWFNIDDDGTILESGSFVYTGGPVTIPKVKFFKSGSTIVVNIVTQNLGPCNSKTTSESKDSRSLQLTVAPNPTTSTSEISLFVPTSKAVRLAVHRTDGALVNLLFQGTLDQGMHQFRWDGCDASGKPLASGLYLIKVTAEHETLTQNILLLP